MPINSAFLRPSASRRTFGQVCLGFAGSALLGRRRLPAADPDELFPSVRTSRLRLNPMLPDYSVPKFVNSYVAQHRNYLLRDRALPNLWAWKDDGSGAVEATVFPEGAGHAAVFDIAVAKDGTIGAAASALDSDGRMAYLIGLFNSSGVPTLTIRTNPFLPQFLCFGPEGAIWAFGRDREAYRRKEDSHTLLRFNRSGARTGEFLPRSSFDSVHHPSTKVGDGGGATRLTCSADRVALYSGPAKQWVEVDSEGAEVVRCSLPSEKRVRTIALLDSGLALGWIEEATSVGLQYLDREAADWVQIPGLNFTSSRSPIGTLLGSDGDELVFYGRSYDPEVFSWHAAPSVKAGGA